ncbi:uncharacterized protein LOC108673541 [Hyalella azteca]|uniref:Uncharacterized protein LOC108673541 n=1 Tax=Hyalella azteca TaxID=294128 RepID=A0A8B7NT41_HYAAZ|nr:uncharacterized protein LOC108673541 [Hyalella azteca]
MRSGKKISKSRLNKWKTLEKLRSQGEYDPSGNAGNAPKISDQNIPKSLLRIMHFTQTQRVPKKPKLNEFKIFTKEDRKCFVNDVALRSHLRHLQRTAMEENERIKKAEDLQEKISAKKEKVQKKKALQSRKPVNVKDLLQLNKQWRKQERSEKKQVRKIIHSKKKKKTLLDAEEEDFAQDLKGFEEVQFGEVAMRPPKLPSIAKIVEKSKKWTNVRKTSQHE